MEKRTDWLGQEYGPGDIVLYALSNSMGIGQVRNITEIGNVTIYPMVSTASWNSGPREILIDRRNGARLSQPRSGWLNKATGKFLTWSEYYAQGKPDEYEHGYEPMSPHAMPVEVMAYPVTVYKGSHIIKWNGDIPVKEKKNGV